MMRITKREIALIFILTIGLGVAAGITRWIDANKGSRAQRFAEEQLYLNGPAARRLTLAFNGLAADWYWMRSLQYVGWKIIAYQDAHDSGVQLTDLSELDLRLLASMLDVTTTLDPQFIAAYEYGAVILPEVNPEAAAALLKKGIAANPTSWRLHQHLGYIYWQRKDYAGASDIYAAGAKLPGAPAWMTALSARLKADAGSREAAREMYRRLHESSDDKTVKEMVTAHLMRLDSLDDRHNLQRLLDYAVSHSRNGRCPSSWKELWQGLADGFSEADLRSMRLRIDAATGAPLDPSGVPYNLIKERCQVALDNNSRVPR